MYNIRRIGTFKVPYIGTNFFIYLHYDVNVGIWDHGKFPAKNEQGTKESARHYYFFLKRFVVSLNSESSTSINRIGHYADRWSLIA